MAAKYAALAIMSSVSCLLIKRSNPEISFLISVAAVTLMYIASCSIMREAMSSLKSTASLFKASSSLILPVLKCIGIAAMTKFSSDLCKDASQSALASAMETAGTLFAAAVSMPVIISMMKMIGGMV